jgi:hypothetical protein
MSERSIRRRRQRKVGSKAALAAGGVLGATVLFAPAAHADTFQVTTTDDELGMGSTPCTDDPSDCALREAVYEANLNGEDDTITFASSVTGTIELDGPNNPIRVRDTVSIQGPGAGVLAISGDDDTQIFYSYGFLSEDDEFAISALTLRDGYDSDEGGAIANIPSGDEAPNLTIESAVLTGNESGYRGGGAVYSDEGSVTILNSQISGNEASQSGGGLFLYNSRGLAVADSVISDNSAVGDGGGGIKTYFRYDVGGPVLIERTTFSGNTADEGYGGGMVIFGNELGDVTIDASTFTGNTADYGGGGVQLWRRAMGSEAVIQNSTFSGNVADAGPDDEEYCCKGGGGISLYNRFDEEDPLTIRNSTIAGNTAVTGGGVGHYSYDTTGYEGNDILRIRSTIVAGNTATEGGPDLSHLNTMEDERDGFFDVGFSLVGSTAGAEVTESPAGTNLFGVDPQLGPLASNGGPTQTHLPAATSPALDKGIANGLATDQRGLARTGDLGAIANATGGDGTDIGATELQVADCRGQSALKIDGTEGNDSLTGSPGPDAISALGGADSANAAGGNDCVNGGGGKDKLKGAGGKDQLKGQAGKDNLKGGGGKDRLAGAGGKDKLSGGGGKDRLKGGPGKDKLKGGGGKDRFNCGGGKDKVTAQEKDKVSASCEKVVEKG